MISQPRRRALVARDPNWHRGKKSETTIDSAHTKIRGCRESSSTLSQGCCPPITTTSASGAQRLFSSFLFTFQRSAASTATQNKSLLSCTVSISFARNYAKRRGMPPKKAVKEEKILLGRPGNNLKSGIVCLPLALKPDCLLIKSRSALQTSASRHSSKLSPNAHSEILL
jgi:hypothetical protein